MIRDDLKMLANHLRARPQRSASPPPSPARPGGNPFRKNAKGERDVWAMMAAVKKNPAEARRLCRAAGESEANWFPNNPR